MGDASMSVTKITRRKVMSVSNGDFEPSLNRYQVYRGLSPETCNRLEIKIQSLEEELQVERQAKIAAQQQCTFLTEELQLQNEHYFGLEGKVSGHFDQLQAKEQELQRLRQEFEVLIEKSESTETCWRKKHQDVVNELNEQIDHLTKQRNRNDVEKRNLLNELGEMSGNLEKAQAAKAHDVAKLEAYDSDLRRMRNELEDKTRQLQDSFNAKTKLIHENGELLSRVKLLESNVDGLNRDKQKYIRELENMKVAIEESESEKPHLISTANSLQIQLNDTKSTLEDEQQRSHLLFSQVQKLQNDFANFKTKAEKDLTLSNDENEAIRKKYLSRIAELEDSLNLLQKKSTKTDKEHAKLVIEIREFADELEKNKAGSAELARKLKNSESLNSEQRFQMDQLTANLQQSESTINKLQTELPKLKSIIIEKDDKLEALTRELRLANESTKECKQEADDAKLQIQDLLTCKNNLEREVTRLSNLLNDLDRKLVESRRCLEVANSDAKQIKDELNAELRLKDEEINGLRKINQKLLDEHHQHLIELEARHKTDVSRTKKLLETEILELSANYDSTTKAQAELQRANKAMANRVKELENALLNEERLKEDLRSQINSVERKRFQAQTELDQLAPRLDSAEHGRKMAELTLHELESKVSELNLSFVAIANDSKRNEAECNSLRMSLEEANAIRREVEDRAERLRLELESTIDALNIQLELHQEKDSTIKQLEKELKEVKLVMEEVEQNALKEGKKLLGKVQARCKGLEMDLEIEQKKSREAQSECKRLHRLLQEITAAKESEERELADKTGQLEAAQANLARLKKQLVEAEEVVTVVTSKYRRLQHQLQEATSEQQHLPETSIHLITERAQSATGHQLLHGVLSTGHQLHHGSLVSGHQLLPGLISPLTGGSARVSIARSYVSSSLANRL